MHRGLQLCQFAMLITKFNTLILVRECINAVTLMKNVLSYRINKDKKCSFQHIRPHRDLEL